MDTRALVVIALVGCGDSQTTAVDARSVDAFEPTPPPGLVAWFAAPGDRTGHYQMVWGGPYSDAFEPGYRGQGFKMDGVIQRALVDTSQVPEKYLDFAGPFSMTAWVRTERVPADYEAIVSRSYGSADDSSYALVIDSNLKVHYDSQGGVSLASSTSLALDTWTHVALTFDGTTKRVFMNGVLEGTQTAAPATYDHKWIDIGADEAADEVHAAHYLLGTIDEVMFFDRALDESELSGL